MKKKIKDLTLEELKNICKLHPYCGNTCPLNEANSICTCNPDDYDDEELSREIEVEDEKYGRGC